MACAVPIGPLLDYGGLRIWFRRSPAASAVVGKGGKLFKKADAAQNQQLETTA